MHHDRFGMAIETSHSVAIAAFESATFSVAAHQPGAPAALRQALDAAPDFVAAHALAGFGHALLAKRESVVDGLQCLENARQAFDRSGGSKAETVMVEALADAVRGEFVRAADRLESHLSVHPGAFLLAKLVNALRFMTGDARGMLASIEGALSRINADHPGHGFMLGCRAFALEELGEFDAAEKLGRRAVEIEPQDSWAIHAVGHVYEMIGRPADGLTWIESRRSTWTRCNNFSLHMSWHAALLHLELDQHDKALQIFDHEVWPRASEDFRDMANAIALLTRLEQFGVDVGSRWKGPASIASKRRADITLTFSALHNLVALVSSGRKREARELVIALDSVGTTEDDQERVRTRIGRTLAWTILELSERRGTPIDFARVLRELPCLGGSNAQRDVFVRMIAGLAADRNDPAAVKTILDIRSRLKREDRFAALVRERVKAGRSQSIAA